MLRSPLNYVGGKYKILPQLQKIFPQSCETFIDLFCGGLNVSMNLEAENYIANDNCAPLIELYRYLQFYERDEILWRIHILLQEYQISKVNEDGFLRLRQDYNETRDPLKLFALASNSFNHQIRFNRHGQFNMPFGRNRSRYNQKMEKNLVDLVDFLHQKKISFENSDFRTLNKIVGKNDFLYADPPYSHSTAVYNTNWTSREDSDLMKLLDGLNCRWALSCVLVHNGIRNERIEEWAKNYTIHPIEWKYSNSNYHKKNRSGGVEVCITNY